VAVKQPYDAFQKGITLLGVFEVVKQMAHPLKVRGNLLGYPFAVMANGVVGTNVVTSPAPDTFIFVD